MHQEGVGKTCSSLSSIVSSTSQQQSRPYYRPKIIFIKSHLDILIHNPHEDEQSLPAAPPRSKCLRAEMFIIYVQAMVSESCPHSIGRLLEKMSMQNFICLQWHSGGCIVVVVVCGFVIVVLCLFFFFLIFLVIFNYFGSKLAKSPKICTLCSKFRLN